jgi:hypothetical protein
MRIRWCATLGASVEGVPWGVVTMWFSTGFLGGLPWKPPKDGVAYKGCDVGSHLRVPRCSPVGFPWERFPFWDVSLGIVPRG